jgi:hypothetical protein
LACELARELRVDGFVGFGPVRLVRGGVLAVLTVGFRFWRVSDRSSLLYFYFYFSRARARREC